MTYTSTLYLLFYNIIHANTAWETPPNNGKLIGLYYLYNKSEITLCEKTDTLEYMLPYQSELKIIKDNAETLRDIFNMHHTTLMATNSEHQKNYQLIGKIRLAMLDEAVNFPTALKTCLKHNGTLLEIKDLESYQAIQKLIKNDKHKKNIALHGNTIWQNINPKSQTFATTNRYIPTKIGNTTISNQMTNVMHDDICPTFNTVTNSFETKNCANETNAICYSNIQQANLLTHNTTHLISLELLDEILKTTKIILTSINALPKEQPKANRTQIKLFTSKELKIVKGFKDIYTNTHLSESLNLLPFLHHINIKLDTLLETTNNQSNRIKKHINVCCSDDHTKINNAALTNIYTESENLILQFNQPVNCSTTAITNILPINTGTPKLKGKFVIHQTKCFNAPTNPKSAYEISELQNNTCCKEIFQNKTNPCKDKPNIQDVPSFYVTHTDNIIISSDTTFLINSTCLPFTTNTKATIITITPDNNCTITTNLTQIKLTTGHPMLYKESKWKKITHTSSEQETNETILNRIESFLRKMLPYIAGLASLATVITCLVSFWIYLKNKNNTRTTTNTPMVNINNDIGPVNQLRPCLKKHTTHFNTNTSSSESSESDTD